MAKPRAILVSAGELAAALGVTRARVSQLANERTIPPAREGRYDLVLCLKSYVAFLKAALVRRPVPQAGAKKKTISDARLRVLEADAEMRELELHVTAEHKKAAMIRYEADQSARNKAEQEGRPN